LRFFCVAFGSHPAKTRFPATVPKTESAHFCLRSADAENAESLHSNTLRFSEVLFFLRHIFCA
jgi:hypothetical protein